MLLNKHKKTHKNNCLNQLFAIKDIMNISKLCLTYALFFACSAPASEIIVRKAENKDLPFLATLSEKVINEHFRKTLIDGYPLSPIVQDSILLNTYITNMVMAFESIFKEEQLQDNRQRLFVAVQDGSESAIIGLCFSQQISDDQAYIRYIIVDKDCRHRGIGSALLGATLDSYKNITSCELKTFSHGNDQVQSFYEKHGFVSDKVPAPLQRKYSEHSDSITFVLYHLDIKS